MLARREVLLGSLAVSAAALSRNGSGGSRSGPPPTSFVRTVPELVNACRKGGRYFVMPGTYRLKDEVLRPTSGTQLIGQAGQTRIYKKTSGPYRTHPFFDVHDVSDVMLENLTFDLDLADGFKEFGVHIRASHPFATSRITVRNCIFKHCYIFAERYTQQITVERNAFYQDSKALGGISTGAYVDIRTGNRISADGLVRNVRIIANYFEQTVGEPVDINWHTRNVLIEGNIFRNCATDGENEIIDIGGPADATAANNCQNIIVRRNRFYNDRPRRVSAIEVKGRSVNVTIADNILYCGGVPGRFGAGVKIWNADDVTVYRNSIEGYAHGIYSTAGGKRIPERVQIRENEIRRFGVSGMQLQGRDFTVEKNRIRAAGFSGPALDTKQLVRSQVVGNDM